MTCHLGEPSSIPGNAIFQKNLQRVPEPLWKLCHTCEFGSGKNMNLKSWPVMDFMKFLLKSSEKKSLFHTDEKVSKLTPKLLNIFPAQVSPLLFAKVS